MICVACWFVSLRVSAVKGSLPSQNTQTSTRRIQLFTLQYASMASFTIATTVRQLLLALLAAEEGMKEAPTVKA